MSREYVLADALCSLLILAAAAVPVVFEYVETWLDKRRAKDAAAVSGAEENDVA